MLVAAVGFPAAASASASPAPPPPPPATAAPSSPVSAPPPGSASGVAPGVPKTPSAPTGVGSPAGGQPATRTPVPAVPASPPSVQPSERRTSLPTLGDPLLAPVITRLTELGRRFGLAGRVKAPDAPRVSEVPTVAAPPHGLRSPAVQGDPATSRPYGSELNIPWRAAKSLGLRREKRVVAGASAWVGRPGALSAPGYSAGASVSLAGHRTVGAPVTAARPSVAPLTSFLRAADRVMMTVPFPIFVFVLALLLGMAALFRRERRRAHEAERVALSDPLTGLPNRLALRHRLAIEWERSRRYGRPLGVVALDLDDLKHVNDRHGHAAGDRLLCDAADILSRRSRRSDAVARLGGDEFVILVSETRGREIAAFADAIRSGLRTGGVRASVGYAELQAGDTDPSDLLGRADADMYRDKRGARHDDLARIRRPDRVAALSRSAKA